ncbi:MAG: TatD family hydrolase [Nanoarchaeota archaeon]|nr:TatD family hydrolase [Nanoarchaeota archaeon]MBU4300183.1 TatD family hydrolase [Nanoarchaeota archaeon]MBU4452057.1 TatD family hydrolase [Nanoarchaeota archaeon]MCG2724438.1 TatD family hydrolase [archaeon]
MKYIDIHCHLQHEKFTPNRDEVIREAKEKMEFLIVAGANPQWNRGAITLSEKHNGFIYAVIGLQPVDCVKHSENEFADELEFIRKSAKKIVGIGEIGLDYHWIKDDKERVLQRERFEKLLKLAEELNLPVVIHSWDAESDAVEILSKHNLKAVVMHCFSGSREVMERALARGYYISFSTAIAFSKSAKKLARDCPLERMVVETDAPYLDPEHKINMPWNTEIVIKKISEAKKLPEERILEQIIKNAKMVFGI